QDALVETETGIGPARRGVERGGLDHGLRRQIDRWLHTAILIWNFVHIASASEPVTLKPSVQRAAAEAERLCGLADVAVEARHRLPDQESFDVLEAHVLDARRRVAIDPQPELADAD